MSSAWRKVPVKPHNGLYVPWDDSMNKNAVIYAVAATLGVRNMPLTS